MISRRSFFSRFTAALVGLPVIGKCFGPKYRCVGVDLVYPGAEKTVVGPYIYRLRAEGYSPEGFYLRGITGCCLDDYHVYSKQEVIDALCMQDFEITAWSASCEPNFIGTTQEKPDIPDEIHHPV